jgi:hypothetical protein
MAIRSLLMLALSKDVLQLQVSGDSMLVIKWMNNEHIIQCV